MAAAEARELVERQRAGALLHERPESERVGGRVSSRSSPPRWKSGGKRKDTLPNTVATTPASPVLCHTGASASRAGSRVGLVLAVAGVVAKPDAQDEAPVIVTGIEQLGEDLVRRRPAGHPPGRQPVVLPSCAHGGDPVAPGPGQGEVDAGPEIDDLVGITGFRPALSIRPKPEKPPVRLFS